MRLLIVVLLLAASACSLPTRKYPAHAPLLGPGLPRLLDSLLRVQLDDRARGFDQLEGDVVGDPEVARVLVFLEPRNPVPVAIAPEDDAPARPG